MKYINEKQKNMLVLYYGLNGEDGKSTKEIGKCLGHSAISVRDMIVGAMIELIAILGYGKEDNQIVTNRK